MTKPHHETTFKIFLLTFVLSALNIKCEKEEPIVNITDNNFLKALFELGIDTDGDGQISHAEAEDVRSLDVSENDISDMTGIEKFVSLDTLICQSNHLIFIDISNNTALEKLDCNDNQLTVLDISNNTALRRLYCELNQFTVLDVSNQPDLDYLYCASNQLMNLDVSNSPELIILSCGGNQLSTLNLSYNSSLGVTDNWTIECHLEIENMPTIEEVCVWTIPFPSDGFKLCMDGSPNVYFTTECSK